MKQLPNNPNLEHLKAQAKDLCNLRKAEDPTYKLTQAQHDLAGEYGFPSWPKLAAHVRNASLSQASRQKAILNLENGIRGGGHAATALAALERDPSLVDASLTSGLVALDLASVQAKLDPVDINASVGAFQASPIVYAAFSPLASTQSERYRTVLTWLLDAGANPSASFIDPDFPEYPLSILYAAAGRIHSPEATALLLARGANPNDNESLYHAAETRDHACLKLLLQAGAKIDGTNALARMLDFEDLEGLQILLAYKPTVDVGVLQHALARGRSEAVVEELIGAGIDPDDPGQHGVTARQLAFERGFALGKTLANPSRASQLLAACWRGDVAEATRLRDAHRELTDRQAMTFTDACWAGATSTVDAFLAGGFTLQDRDPSKGTPLHCAAFAGHVETVQALLAHHPPLDDRKDQFEAIPLQWAAYSSQFNEGRHPEVVQQLIDAGSPPPSHLMGSPEVRRLLSARWPSELSEAESD